MGIKVVIAFLAMMTLCLGATNNSSSASGGNSTNSNSASNVNNITVNAGGGNGYGAGYGAAGCGLGSVILPGRGLVSQISAGTTNAASGQFVSMTTGISNCDTGLFNLFSSNNLEFMKFMNNNMDKIALDISKGNGEYLKHISKVYNVEYLSLSKKLQANFTEIYTYDNIQVDEVIFNIEKVINS